MGLRSFADSKVVLYDQIDTAVAYLNQKTELFKVVRMKRKDALEEAAKAEQEQKFFLLFSVRAHHSFADESMGAN